MAIFGSITAGSAYASATPLTARQMANTRGGLVVDAFDVPRATQTRSKFDNVQTAGRIREFLATDTIDLRIFAGGSKIGAQTVATTPAPNNEGRLGNFRLRTGNGSDFPFAGPSDLSVRFLVPPEDREAFDCPADPKQLCIRTAGNTDKFPRSVTLEPAVGVNRVQIHNLRDVQSGETTFLDPFALAPLLDNASFDYNRRGTPSVDGVLGQANCSVSNTMQLRLDNGAVSGYNPFQPLDVPAGCTRFPTCGDFNRIVQVFEDLAQQNGGDAALHVFVVNAFDSPNTIGVAPFRNRNGQPVPLNFVFIREGIDRLADLPGNPLRTMSVLAHEYGHNRSLQHPDQPPSRPNDPPPPPEANDCADPNSPTRNLMCSTLTVPVNTHLVPEQCRRIREGRRSSVRELNN